MQLACEEKKKSSTNKWAADRFYVQKAKKINRLTKCFVSSCPLLFMDMAYHSTKISKNCWITESYLSSNKAIKYFYRNKIDALNCSIILNEIKQNWVNVYGWRNTKKVAWDFIDEKSLQETNRRPSSHGNMLMPQCVGTWGQKGKWPILFWSPFHLINRFFQS